MVFDVFDDVCLSRDFLPLETDPDFVSLVKFLGLGAELASITFGVIFHVISLGL